MDLGELEAGNYLLRVSNEGTRSHDASRCWTEPIE